MLNTQNLKDYTNLDGNSVQLEIDLAQHNLQVNGRKVESITMFADTDCCGDLAVNWEEVDDAAYEDGNSMLLMRNTDSEDVNTETMGKFYWDGEFTQTLQQLLQQYGFSATAAHDVCTSEWGMQDVGRASYDANVVAEEILAAHNLVLEDA